MNRFGGTVRRPYQPPESQADPEQAPPVQEPVTEDRLIPDSERRGKAGSPAKRMRWPKQAESDHQTGVEVIGIILE